MIWLSSWYNLRGWLGVKYQESIGQAYNQSVRQSISQSSLSPWRCRLPVPTPAAQRRRRSLGPPLPHTSPAWKGPATQPHDTHYPQPNDCCCNCRLSYGVPCAIACIYICAHVKDPVVHVRVRWIMGTLKYPACTLGWVARLCCSSLSPGKATQISHGRSPIGTIQL